MALPPVGFSPSPNPRKPKLALPPGSWDTHFHVVGPPHKFPYQKLRHFTPPGSPVEHYLATARFLGFARGVVVHHNFHGFDLSVTIDALKKSEGRLCGMALADPALDSARLKELHAVGFRGIRVSLTAKLGGTYDTERFDRIVELAARARWVVALHIDSPMLDRLSEVIRRMPVITILENYAAMDARLGPAQHTLKTLLQLADEPHVWLKLASAHRMIDRGASYEQVREIARLAHARSPQRTIWGTDWPHGGVIQPGKMFNDGDLVDMLLDFVPDESARRWLLVENPARLYDGD